MTSFEITRFPLDDETPAKLRNADARYADWPVVYILNNDRQVYVGETANAARRMSEHRKDAVKSQLEHLRIVLDDGFHKSVCLDLESYLTRYLHGNGRHEVVNDIRQLTSHEYPARDTFHELFEEVFAELRDHGLFDHPIEEIENSDLFKYSPFKTLNHEQADAVTSIVEGLFADIAAERPSSIVVQGSPGTGKTIVAISLLKLLRDIGDDTRTVIPETPSDTNTFDAALSTHGNTLRNRRIGLVVPQQSLRATLRKAFDKTGGLSADMVLSPFDVGEAPEPFDVLVVDEAHRLKLRAGLANGVQYNRYDAVSEKLLDWQPSFGEEDGYWPNQLDWIRQHSRHQIWMFDSNQTVMPADIPAHVQRQVIETARDERRFYELRTQMRVRAGFDYPAYIRQVLSDTPPSSVPEFSPYDLKLFDDFGDMADAIRWQEAEHGLARLVAGYAWPWRSKKDKTAFDIEIDGHALRWNTTDKEWIESPTSPDEVGSIHTVQGYDLNYAGVVIGPDLGFDTTSQRLVLHRKNYHDRNGKSSPRKLGITYDDDAILGFVRNVYAVLLTRGIRGTYVYVCDPALRERLRPYFPAADAVPADPAWAESLQNASQAESRLLGELVRTLAADLEGRFPAPTVGPRRLYETPCLLVWSTHRVAVVSDDVADDRRQVLRNAGWRVVGTDPAEITKALRAAVRR